MSASMGMPVYYSAETKQLMPMVKAEDVAAAVVMGDDLIAEIFPHGLTPGFTPMIVGGAGGGVVAAAKEAVADVVGEASGEKAEKKSKKEKKDKTKKVKTSSKKKKGCC